MPKVVRYRVYRNLHKNLWSIVRADTRYVIGHCEEVKLEQCQFIVGMSGKKRAMEQNVRNVHAYIEGYVVEISGFVPYKERELVIATKSDLSFEDPSVPVTYRPFENTGFFKKYNKQEIHSADIVWLKMENGIAEVLVP